MPLTPNTFLGQYEVVESIGAGGMGEVYRARDTKLGRDVAIKVLPEEFAQNKERLDRFEREARLLAQLNHSNIATLHGLEEHDGQKFIVMELVEGETLAERIAKGPLPVDEAMTLFIQIAEGLEAAHEKGIVHRDLKPANIKIGPDGKPKILDFGLAKAFVDDAETPPDSSHSPTLTKGTALGAIMGTASYMSPEQARGKPVDKRTDIWAFGCCLYEALAGTRAFEGETVTDILAAVVNSEPGWSGIPAAVPSHISRLLRRTLEKNPRSRLHDIGDARIELERLTLDEADDAVQSGASSTFMKWAPWMVAVLVALVALWQKTTLAPPELQVQRYEMELPRASAGGSSIALSPDGTLFTYTGRGLNGEWSIYLRPVGELEAREIAGTAGGEYQFFSPDSRWLGFFAFGEIRQVPIEGGTPTVICKTPETIGSTWGRKGDIVFGMPNDGLYRVSANGGEPVRITDPTELGGTAHIWPRFLPDGESVLFTVWRESDPPEIAIHSLASGTSTVLVQGNNPRYAATGHILFTQNGAVRGAAFDSRSRALVSESRELLSTIADGLFGLVWYDIADTGHLVYSDVSPARLASSELLIVDADGTERSFPEDTEDAWIQPQYSPSGSRIAFVGVESRDGRWDISSYDPNSRRSVPVTPGSGLMLSAWPVWSPDERWLAFVSNRGGYNFNTFRAAADGSGLVEQLTFAPHLRTIPTSWSVNNVLAVEQGSNDQRDILVLPMANGEERTLEPFLVTEFNERGAQFSPDGNWLAFISDRSGRDEVWVSPYPGAGAPILVSLGGGKEARWSGDGRRLFYRHGDEMWAVPVQSTQESFEVGEPELLFRGDYSYGYIDWNLNYGVHPTRQSFLMVKDGPPPKLRVVVNWFQELERLVPTKN